MKLPEREGEIYILARSAGRVDKERGMRRRRLKRLIKRLKELQAQKLDATSCCSNWARPSAGRAYALIEVELPPKEQAALTDSFRFRMNRAKLRQVRRREGHYLSFVGSRFSVLLCPLMAAACR